MSNFSPKQVISVFFVMLTFNVFISKAQVSTTEYEALVALYNATNGDGWTNKTNWNLAANNVSNDWYGITVQSGNVVEINLISNNLTGALPSEIGNLVYLKKLRLNNNKLSGTIPDAIGNLDVLETLSLNVNDLENCPPTLGSNSLPAIKSISLNENDLTGPFPEFVINSTLETLNLNSNNFSGELPSSIEGLSSVKLFFAEFNQFSGSLPDKLYNLSTLTHIVLAKNNFTGSLSPRIGELTELRWLHLSHNQFSGTLPPEIGSLALLERLSIQYNAFSGALPSSIGGLANLDYFDVQSNQFSGSLPDELYDMTNVSTLQLAQNGFTAGLTAAIGNLQSLTSLRIQSNKFEGTLPAELFELPALTSLDVSGNKFSGSIPATLTTNQTITNLSFFGNDFAELPRLSDHAYSFLSVAGNRFSFADIERSFDILMARGGSYHPQRTYHAYPDTVTAAIGSPLVLTGEIGGANNKYQWTKLQNNSVVYISPSGDSPELKIDNISSSDAGKYYFTVTNTVVANLAISSDQFYIKPVDVTNPEFSVNFPAVLNVTDQSATLSVRLNEPGRCYFVILEASSPAPSVGQIKEGKDGNNASVNNNLKGSIEVANANTSFTFNITGLSSDQAYKAYVVARDMAGNMNNAAAIVGFQTLMPVSVENKLLNQIAVYPNPTAGGKLILHSKNTQTFEWQLSDMFGRPVSVSHSEEAGFYAIDVTPLPAAIYVLRLKNNEGTSTIKIMHQ